MSNKLKGIIFIEEELKGIPGFKNYLKECKGENRKLKIWPILSKKKEGTVMGKTQSFSREELYKTVGDFRETCIFIGATDESLALAKEFRMAAVAVRNPKLEERTGVRAELTGTQYLLDFEKFTEEEIFDQTGYEYLERAYRRFHNIPWDILETSRCQVRELTLEDVDGLYSLYADPKMTEFLEPLYDLKEEVNYQKAYIENMYRFYEYGMWLVFDKRNNRLIGRAGLENREYPEGMELEMGYAFAPQYWHKGYATEVCKAMLEYAEDYLDADHVNCLIQPDNKRSIKLADRIGMKFKEETDFTGEKMLRYQFDLKGSIA